MQGRTVANISLQTDSQGEYAKVESKILFNSGRGEILIRDEKDQLSWIVVELLHSRTIIK